MSDFLSVMAQRSRVRAAAAGAREPLSALRARALATPPGARLRLNGFDVVAEAKAASPSEGSLLPAGTEAGPWVCGRAAEYLRSGAAAVSVLTEPSAFSGHLEHLSAVCALGLGPAMRKDFLVEPYQVLEARAAGASGVLLIVRMLTDGLLREMLDAAAEMSLFVLVEAFDEDDLARVGRVLRREPAVSRSSGHDADVMVGVNTRDLATLGVNRGRLDELVSAIPAGLPRVAESGLVSAAGCGAAARAGFHAALVGTALTRATDAAGLLREMIGAGRAAAQGVGR